MWKQVNGKFNFNYSLLIDQKKQFNQDIFDLNKKLEVKQITIDELLIENNKLKKCKIIKYNFLILKVKLK